MNTLRMLIAAMIAAVSLARGQQKEGFPPDNPDSWRLAGTAKVFCSALFVSKRDSAEARRNIASYFLGPKHSISAISIDRTRKLVRMRLANRITREAKQYGDQGCVIHQPGRDSVFFTPVRVTTSIPPASNMPWPMGEVLPTTPLPAHIDTAKLRQATDAAFANPSGLTAAFVVVHDGRIIAERYTDGAHRHPGPGGVDAARDGGGASQPLTSVPVTARLSKLRTSGSASCAPNGASAFAMGCPKCARRFRTWLARWMSASPTCALPTSIPCASRRAGSLPPGARPSLPGRLSSRATSRCGRGFPRQFGPRRAGNRRRPNLTSDSSPSADGTRSRVPSALRLIC